LIKGKIKIELPKTTVADKITLDQAEEMIAAQGSKKPKGRAKSKSKK
jgi:DNA topoisomerase-1